MDASEHRQALNKINNKLRIGFLKSSVYPRLSAVSKYMMIF